jgi:hypothetical protein
VNRPPTTLGVIGLLVAALVLVGCVDAIRPIATPGASGPSTTAAPTAPPFPPSGTIDQQFTTPALDYRNTGEYLVWSTGVRGAVDDTAPDLYGTRPGEVPQLLYDNPERDSRLEVVGGNGSRFAFVEYNTRAFGRGVFKLRYIPGPGKPAVVIDEGDSELLPFFAVSGDRIVWTVVHGDPRRSELRVLDVRSMTTTVLLSSDPLQIQYWFPAIDGDRIVVGSIEPNADYTSDQRHIYLVDLAAGGAPTRLDHSKSASEPAIHGDTVIWKESDPTMHLLNYGTIVRYSLSTRTSRPIDFPVERLMGFTDPSIGSRFATAWHQDFRHLYIADVRTDRIITVADFETRAEMLSDGMLRNSASRAVIAGDLLSYVFARDHDDLELRWVDVSQAYP